MVCKRGLSQKVGLQKAVLSPAHFEKAHVFCGRGNGLIIIGLPALSKFLFTMRETMATTRAGLRGEGAMGLGSLGQEHAKLKKCSQMAPAKKTTAKPTSKSDVQESLGLQKN